MSQKKTPKPADQFFQAVDDEKLRISLIAMADHLDESARKRIYATYNDSELHSYYKGLRASRAFQKGGKSKVHRQIVRFPNVEVYQFVDRVMSALHGEHWEQDKRNLKHELIRPWWVVEKL